MINLSHLYSAPELYERLVNSPEYTDTLGGLFDEDEEEKKRRAAMIGNYTQQQQRPSPQFNFGQDRDTNLFDMFYL